MTHRVFLWIFDKIYKYVLLRLHWIYVFLMVIKKDWTSNQNFGNPLWLPNSYAPSQIRKIEKFCKTFFKNLKNWRQTYICFLHSCRITWGNDIYSALCKDKITALKIYLLNLILVTGFVFFVHSRRNVICSWYFTGM